MGFHNIEKQSFVYNTLYHYVKFWHSKVFYRKVIILNYNKVPSNKPLIFTPNHQNALMDALALLFSIKNQLVFMARSDIFKKFAPILYFLKILPVYRIRDGFDSLKRNRTIFDKTVDVLNAYNGLVILPEGNHINERHLRPLKKGFARIAFQTALEGNLDKDLMIVPTGIDYDSYTECRSRLIINFGDPFPVADFIDDYKENSAKGLNKIKDHLAERIKQLIINIESAEYYELIDNLRVLYRERMCKKTGLNPNDEADGFYADKKFVEIINESVDKSPETVAEMDKIYKNLIGIMKGFKLQPADMKSKPSKLALFAKIILLVTGFPLFLYGFINHLLAFKIPYCFTTKKIKDKSFKTSFLYVLTLLSFPFFYFVQSLTVLLVFHSWKIALIYLISLPVSAIIAWKWKNLFLNIKTDLRKLKFIRTGLHTKATELFNDLLNKTDDLVDNKLSA